MCSLPADQESLRVVYYPKYTPEEGAHVQEKVSRILASTGIQYTEMTFTGRLSWANSEPAPVQTVPIVAEEWLQTEKWPDVTKQIFHDIAGDLSGYFSVELIDEIL